MRCDDRLATFAFRETLRSTTRTKLAPSTSAEMKEIERIVEKVKDSDVPVLLLGETGTGKEVIARTIHYTGAYRDRPFVGVNCASLNENLIESELFGHEKGAFSGAIARKIGRFELAGNGTLFLDEIGDMSLAMQSKLLRVLQERTLERVGGTKTVSVYCRLIAATNKDLTSLRARGGFPGGSLLPAQHRHDEAPDPARSRRDIPAFVRQFVEEANAAYGRSVKTVPEPLMRSLVAHPWPGNIRQLKNVITNAVILSDGEEISGLELRGRGSSVGRHTHGQGPAHDGGSIFHRDRRDRSSGRCCRRTTGNISRTAVRLGISRKTLYEKIRRHDL